MSKTYFISDAHLGLGSKEEEREKELRIVRFLQTIAADAQQVFIVGDLFDAWFEYKTVIPKGHHRLLTQLEDLVQSNIAVHYLAGNHDFWMGNFFQKELGISTYSEPIETIIDGKRFLIHHGDGLATHDTGYRILKKILRNPLAIALYKWIHPDIGIRIAKSSSRKSRHHTASKDYGEQDGMIQFATEQIQRGIDVVVMGHSHQPSYKKIGTGVYVNLGDWIGHHTYAEVYNGNVELKTWQK